jgi:UDP-N-acetylglucosamine--N-acetylmuramyl-(pentapeptide) pyrophosphoryl-undecaprenol N-acetylglucosamine transferase
VGLLGQLRGLARLPVALVQSLSILRRFRPDAVLGVGGYASGPVVAAAALARYPSAILEQNTVPGFTNRALGPLVRAVFTAFEATHASFPRRKIVATGNPLRRSFLAAATAAAGGPGGGGRGRVLVVGGSQGSRAVNDRVVEAVRIWAAAGGGPTVVHQTGSTDAARVTAAYAALALPAGTVEVRPFIDNMAAACRQADLVVARAGALTLAELSVLGIPAILIPLPTAADDHQTKNAAAFADRGAALLLAQTETTGDRLAREVTQLLADPPRLQAMSAAMTALSRPRAAADITDHLESLTRH